MFNFVPKLLFIFGKGIRTDYQHDGYWEGFAVFDCAIGSGITIVPTSLSNWQLGKADSINLVSRYIGHPIINLSGNTVSWYITINNNNDTPMMSQMNGYRADMNISTAYQYIAIG